MESIKIFLKGMAIGFANIIPGVSGGTFAFIFGIYDRLTEAIGNFFINSEKRKDYFFFLLKVFAGAAFSILVFAKALTFLLEYNQTSKQITYFFFIGLIGGSIPFIVKSHNDMGINFKRILILFAGIILILFTIIAKGETSGNIDHTSLLRLLWVFFCGLFSGGAMIIPGFSGSALMVSLGEYENIVSLYLGNIREYIIPTIVFGMGAAAGIIAFAKAVEICFKNFKAETLYFILGLIGASLIQIFFKTSEGFDFSPLPMTGVVAALIFGFALAYFTSKIEKQEIIAETP
jgi:putative membrane protein